MIIGYIYVFKDGSQKPIDMKASLKKLLEMSVLALSNEDQVKVRFNIYKKGK